MISNLGVKYISDVKEEKTKQDKIKAGIGALTGTIIPLALMMKKRNIKNPLKMEYKLQDMLILSASSVTGSVIAGSTGKDKKTKEKKTEEGVFQFLNASLPAIGAACSLKALEKSSFKDNKALKILSLAGSVVFGMFASSKAANFIVDPKNTKPDRKFTPKDCLTGIDDLIGVLALTKAPFVQALNVDKMLPLVYSYCGYRAGSAK